MNIKDLVVFPRMMRKILLSFEFHEPKDIYNFHDAISWCVDRGFAFAADTVDNQDLGINYWEFEQMIADVIPAEELESFKAWTFDFRKSAEEDLDIIEKSFLENNTKLNKKNVADVRMSVDLFYQLISENKIPNKKCEQQAREIYKNIREVYLRLAPVFDEKARKNLNKCEEWFGKKRSYFFNL